MISPASAGTAATKNAVVKRRLQVMIAEMNGEPELPLGDDFDPETGEVFEGGRAS